MLGWFKKKKPEPVPPDPTVQYIIESLASNPEVWELHETEEIDHWEECEEEHPDAKEQEKRKWNSGRGRHVDWWQRPIMRFVFRLKHEGGTIVVIDHDATDYLGWLIEEPRHRTISKSDSDLLSNAVKKWRDHMVLHDLSKNAPEKDPLKLAFKELEAKEAKAS